MLDDLTIRLECLRLAAQLEREAGAVSVRAAEFYRFVRNAPEPEPVTR